MLVTAGAAEAFTLIARALRPGRDVRRPVVVHPQFTEPEVALTVAGHRVERVLLRAEDGFALDPSAVPADADLVVVGNPTNPTSVLHSGLAALARPGRVLVVDEAFMDAVPGEPGSPAAQRLPGVIVVRSLTKTWGLAGLRAGYVIGPRGCRGPKPPGGGARGAGSGRGAALRAVRAGPGRGRRRRARPSAERRLRRPQR